MTNEERIKECEVEIKNLKKSDDKIDLILNQVSNHLQTQIETLTEKNDSDHQRIYDKLDKIIWYIAISLIATTAISIIAQIYLKNLT